MKNIILLLLTFSLTGPIIAQKNYVPKVRTVIHKLGDDRIRIKLFQYGRNKDIVFINLHSNETTSVAGVENLLQIHGGLLIKLENNNNRNISFGLDNNFYTFDPNRIFSRLGIEKTLLRFRNTNSKAVAEVEKFASRILSLLPKEPFCVVALHNNTEGALSVSSFSRGSEYAADAKKVFAADDQDPDDFFLTTDSLLFHQLSAAKYNTVWQDNLHVQQDGSLSVYCGEKNTLYLNCETEHGKTKQYEEMIRVALAYIIERKNNKECISRRPAISQTPAPEQANDHIISE